MDAWQRQRELARTTTVWAVASIAGGAVLTARRDPRWRSFGQQHVGWGVIDLGIVVLGNTLQARRMRRLGNPYGPVELEQERRKLRRVLLINVVADAGYIALGTVLWRRRQDPRLSGAGAAIIVQGTFLLLHDAHHAAYSSARRSV